MKEDVETSKPKKYMNKVGRLMQVTTLNKQLTYNPTKTYPKKIKKIK